MSAAQTELRTSAALPAWSAKLAGEACVAVTYAAPYAAPGQCVLPAALTLGDIVARLFEDGLLDRAWAPALVIFVGDEPIPPALWAKTRARPGRLVTVRALPQDFASITAIAWQIVQNVAIAYAVNAVVQAFTTAPEAVGIEQAYSIDGARNEIVTYRPVPVVLGRKRVFPPHAAKWFTRAVGEKVYLYALLTPGLGPYELDEDSLQIGETPFSAFAGVEWQAKMSPGDADPTLFPRSADEQEGPGLVEASDGWIARTTESDECDEIEAEIAFIEGLIRFTSSGGTDSVTAEYRIRYREEGATDWLAWSTGSVNTEGSLFTLTKKTRKPFRETHTREVTRGRYEVAVKRVTEDYDNANIKTVFHWTRLRSFTNEPPVNDPNLALFALKIEAGDQLNGMIDQINMIVTRVAPLWDAEEEEFGAAGPTQNPAELVRWIATGPGVANPRDGGEEIDAAGFGAWAERCTAMDWRCDLELRAGAGLDEIMQAVARCGRAVLGERAGKLTPILDDAQAAPVQLFTPRNTWGFRAQRRYPREAHGLRVAFENEAKGYRPDALMVFYPGYAEETAELIEDRSAFGKTRGIEAAREGWRAIAEDVERGEDYFFRADIENLTVRWGSRIEIAHYAVAVGRKSARVKALTLNEAETHVLAVTLDEIVMQTLGEDYAIRWRRIEEDALSVENLAVETVSGASATIALAAEGGVPVAAAPKLGDLVTFGDAEIATLDCVVTNIVRASRFEAEISATAYSDGLWEGDADDEPEWSSNVSADAFPPPPAPEWRGIAATGTGIFADFDFAIGTAGRVEGVEAYWKPANDDGARYELAAALGADERLAAYPAGEKGRFYNLKLVAIGERGRRAESEERTVQSTAFGAPFTAELTQPSAVVATAADGSGGDYSAAGGVMRVRLGGVDITEDNGVAYAVIGTPTGGLAIAIDDETGVYTVTGLEENAGQAVLRATKAGDSIDLTYAIAKARAGAPGAPGDPPSGFVATIDLSNSSTGVNLRSVANANGYTGFSDAEIIFEVESGVTITGVAGAPSGGIAIDTGEWPVSEYTITLTLIIKTGGVVMGGGGRGGGPESAGASGGHGVMCRVPMEIEVEGALRGGGGGGGGGGRGFDYVNEIESAPGGGGGGRPNGPGGSPGSGFGGTQTSAPTSGGTASPTANGAGGDGEGRSGPGGAVNGGVGGQGGTFGASGIGGGAGSGPGGGFSGAAAGAGGNAVKKNGHTVPVTGGGEITGAVG